MKFRIGLIGACLLFGWFILMGTWQYQDGHWRPPWLLVASGLTLLIVAYLAARTFRQQ